MLRYTVKSLPGLLLLLVNSTTYTQSLPQEDLQLLKTNTTNICGDRDFSKADWQQVTTNLENKSIILIGEFNHGSKEIFEIRNSLIKQLTKKLSIKVILFESGIGELITADYKKKDFSASQMINGLFAGWRTKEFVDLMDYVKSENISIAGFDIQRSGGSFAILLKEIAQRRNIDTSIYIDLEARYGLLNGPLSSVKTVYDSVKTKTETLIRDYRAMGSELSKYQSTDSSRELSLVIVTIQNRIKYLSYMLQFVNDKNFNNRWAARDAAMASNVDWLLTNIYKSEPVIIIGHNYHIAQFNDKESVMGELMLSEYSKKMYSIGVFAGTGSFADNSGKEKSISPADSTSMDIKHVIASLTGSVNYVDINKVQKPGRYWLDNEITVNDTFINLDNGNKMTLSKSFDGLLLIDRVSPPAPRN